MDQIYTFYSLGKYSQLSRILINVHINFTSNLVIYLTNSTQLLTVLSLTLTCSRLKA